MLKLLPLVLALLLVHPVAGQEEATADSKPKKNKKLIDGIRNSGNPNDARNTSTGQPDPVEDPAFAAYALFENTSPHPPSIEPIATNLPLEINAGDRIAFVGNTLFDLAREHGYFESLLHQRFTEEKLTVRNLAWSADEVDLQPRPANFADTDQHLHHIKADVIFAAFGFNESFAGEEAIDAFKVRLTTWLLKTKSKAYNGKTAPRIVLVSPIANESVGKVFNSYSNNNRLKAYTQAMAEVAAEQEVGFADVFSPTFAAISNSKRPLTFNGAHLNDEGYQVFANALFRATFDETPPVFDAKVQHLVVDKAYQWANRFRPPNTFYYTGGRNKTYGYLDFLPAMRNFEILAANRGKAIWSAATGEEGWIDDSNVPEMPETKQSRGANKWMSAEDEYKAFQIDPRFEVNLFASEEQFPDIAAPIQMRWDAKGRLWVSCSTTYPHVYPGNYQNDKIVILEDTDRDGRADKSTVFADDLHIPLSFVLGNGGVYVSEEPHLTFLRDTDGDDIADERQILLTGFGMEDSHHALHDFVWTPDGDLIFRESIFHHTQVETPRGPVRQANSGWFRFRPSTHEFTSFGTYHSTNPWGVTFDKWGQHVASHPIYAAAHHSLDPPYPEQHPKPTGLQAYSGVCGHEFVDFGTFPDELEDGKHFIKVRYKPTNRVEIHQWHEREFGYEEEYIGDLLFSTNLSFIPVDLGYGPDGAMYVCDWYNPVKGHAQYSLRDERRDRHSGRIWRIMGKGKEAKEPIDYTEKSIPELVELLARPEYRVRYWAKRELRDRNKPNAVKKALDKWVAGLQPGETDYRHHQIEAVWLYRSLNQPNIPLLMDLLACDNPHARAAATQQLRYHGGTSFSSDSISAAALLRERANDESAIVRMEAAIAASWIGTKEALVAMLDVLKHPHDDHLSYAIRCALGSHTLVKHWKRNDDFLAEHPELNVFLAKFDQTQKLKPPKTTAQDAQFDSQKNLKEIEISCVEGRMLFTVTQFEVEAGQPVKLLFTNPDATAHNLLISTPGSLEEIGMAGNDMAKDPDGFKKHFVPDSNKVLHATKLLPPNTAEVLRFNAPEKPGTYPYLCTFPGHWVIMKGEMIVK
ncbi:MAG: PVC-type heme-binding CxxCH protein [Verrucomicrobiota bacterium]